MSSKYLKDLSSDDYSALTKKLHTIQNGVCYICQKAIDLDIHTTNIDHIIPLANRGKIRKIILHSHMKAATNQSKMPT